MRKIISVHLNGFVTHSNEQFFQEYLLSPSTVLGGSKRSSSSFEDHPITKKLKVKPPGHVNNYLDDFNEMSPEEQKLTEDNIKWWKDNIFKKFVESLKCV